MKPAGELADQTRDDQGRTESEAGEASSLLEPNAEMAKRFPHVTDWTEETAEANQESVV